MKHIEKNSRPSVGRVNHMHEKAFPVIHIDLNGRIRYANKASFPLLREWNCLASDCLPGYLVEQHPQLVNPEADFDLLIETTGAYFHLDVVGFRESGYIGLYGFRTINKNTELKKRQLRVAGL